MTTEQTAPPGGAPAAASGFVTSDEAPATLHREHRSPVVSIDAEARRVTVQLCRWREPRTVVDEGVRYREQYAEGSLSLAEPVHVVDQHHGELIGRADPATFAAGPDGPTVELILADTERARDVLALVRAGVIQAVSMEVEPCEQRRLADGTVERTLARVHGIAFAFRPAHSAPILATREHDNITATSDREVAAMTDTTTEAPPLERVTPTVTAQPATAADLEALHRDLDDLRRDVIAVRAIEDPAEHPLARFRSFAEYAEARYTAAPEEARLLHRVLADQITANNPGVIPEAWLTEVQGIVEQARATIRAFGRSPLPEEGMSVDFPYFNGDLDALVDQQATEKTGINSVQVDLLRASYDINTYAGGSDISYQLIRRSRPSYQAQYLRIMTTAWARRTELSAALRASGDATLSAGDSWLIATGDLAGLAGALIDASVQVEDATGMPASFALAATDVFKAAAKLTGMYPSTYGDQATAGVSSAGTLSVEVSDIPIIHARKMPAGTLLVSNSAAGEWHEDGPATVTAEDVERLGMNVAVWGMGVFLPLVPAGLVRVPTV